MAIASGFLIYKSAKLHNKKSSLFLITLVSLMFLANISGFINSILTYYNAEQAYSNKGLLIGQQVFFYVEMLSANLLYWTYAANYWSLSM